MATVDWTSTAPLLAALAAAVAVAAWLARRHALRRGLVDLPGERRSHRVPTPRGGGIGIALAWPAACAALALGGLLPGSLALAAASGSLLVGIAGYVDDHRPLSPWWRLAAHVTAGGLLAAALAWAGAASWLVLFAIVAVPVLVNVWNFMDGIDGLATSQAALAAVAVALLATVPGVRLAALALLAACVGFLPLNFPRARIFLGDVGSGVLGHALATLACLLLFTAEGEAPGLLPVVFLPLSAFLLDASLTLGRRIVRRERWWTPHVGHAYQRLAAALGSHVPVTVAYGAWTVLALGLAQLASGQGFAIRMAAAGGVAVSGILAWRLLTGWRTGPCKDAPG